KKWTRLKEKMEKERKGLSIKKDDGDDADVSDEASGVVDLLKFL
ncbi:hypothetical protein A2U01_0018703, partial [Trifolium medium]|nr:hypothetical protein [Trifolium medium]